MAVRELGLKVVWPPPELSVTTTLTLDIVAIHGLDTYSPRTWEAFELEGDEQSRLVNWLSDSDMLPNDVRNARILTYDYDASYHHDAPLSTIESQAYSFLRLLSLNRKKVSAENRPLLFIASCFGGLVLVKAMHLASGHMSEHQSIFSAVAGITFLATPFRGSRAAGLTWWKQYVSGIMGEETSSTLIRDLEQNNPQIEETIEKFAILARESQIPIHCFYESKHTSMSSASILRQLSRVMIVDKHSATLDSFHRTEICVKHALMNKFRGPSDANYQLVVGVISEFANKVENLFQFRRNNDGWITDCKRHLYEIAPHYESHAEQVYLWAPGTCQWITKDPKFEKWINADSSSLLWVTGNPGCGKSVLAKFLNSELAQSKSHFVCPFFFKKGLLHQEKAYQALASFLHRMISKNRRSAPLSLYVEYEAKGKSGFESVKGMWSMLLETSSAFQSTILILDALDECESESRKAFMECLVSTYTQKNTGIDIANGLKILITSRPENDIQDAFSSFQELRIKREDQTDEINQDVKRAVEAEINSFKHLGSTICQYLSHAFEDRISDCSFLLVHIIFEKLRALRSKNLQTVKAIVEGSGKELDDQYDQVLEKSDNPGLTAKLLDIIVTARRPLTVDEVNIAMNVNSECRKFDDIDLFKDDVEAAVKDLGGFMVRVSKSHVYLVHETARAYLFRKSQNQNHSPAAFTNVDRGHWAMYQSCVWYLGLQDWVEVAESLGDLNDYGRERVKFLKESGIKTRRAYRYWDWDLTKAFDEGTVPVYDLSQHLHEMAIRHIRTHSGIKCGASEFYDYSFENWLHHLKEAGKLISTGFHDRAHTRESAKPMFLNIACLFGHADLVQLLIFEQYASNLRVEGVGRQSKEHTSRNINRPQKISTRDSTAALLAAVISGDTDTENTLVKHCGEASNKTSIECMERFCSDLLKQRRLRLGHISMLLMQLWSIQASRPNPLWFRDDRLSHIETTFSLPTIMGYEDMIGRLKLHHARDPPDENGSLRLKLALAAMGITWVDPFEFHLDQLRSNEVANDRATTALLALAALNNVGWIYERLTQQNVSLTGFQHSNQLLWYAVRNKRLILLDRLHGAGIDLSIMVHKDKSALHLCVSNGVVRSVFDWLVDRLHDHNARDGNGRTALHLASTDGHLEIVEVLLKHKDACRPDLVDAFNRTSLLDAIHLGHMGIARCLIEHGASVNVVAGADSTALHAILNSFHLPEADSIFSLILSNYRFTDESFLNLGKALVRGSINSGRSISTFIDAIAQSSSRISGLITSSSKDEDSEILSSRIWGSLKLERTESGGNMLHWTVQCAKEVVGDCDKESVDKVVNNLVDNGVAPRGLDHGRLTPIDFCQKEIGSNEDCQALVYLHEALAHVAGSAINEQDFDAEFESYVFHQDIAETDEDAFELGSASESGLDVDPGNGCYSDERVDVEAGFDVSQSIDQEMRDNSVDSSSSDELFDAQAEWTGSM